jgi:ABC-2 type transport system ATP-binding protein
MVAAVEVTGLTKSFKKVEALRGLDLSIEEGTAHGILGPNGAGKTTTVRILSTLIPPDAGEATVCGASVVNDPRTVRASIALTGQYAALDERLTGMENLRMIGRLFRLSTSETKSRADSLLKRFELADAAGRAVGTYSGGMRRRLDLAASMMGNPRLIFLDEPTTGLDPRARRDVWGMVEQMVHDGITVVLTTQSLEEADRLASGLTVIDNGKAVATGSPEELKDRVGGNRIEVQVADRGQTSRGAELLRSRLGSAEVDEEHNVVTAPWKPGDTLADVIIALKDEGVDVADIRIREITLDDVFLALTGHPAKQDGEEEEEAGK